MSKFKRIWYIISGLAIILWSVLMINDPEDAIILTSFLIAVILVFKGLKNIIYYLTMARHMVGGKIILYYGIVLYDLGVFAVSISVQSRIFTIIYLIAIHLFAGGVSILRLFRNHKEGFSIHKLDIAQATVNLLIALVCIFFMRSTNILVYAYCASIIYLAVLRIISAFRKTAIVYIQ